MKLYAVLGGVAVAGLLAGTWVATRGGDDVFAQCRASQVVTGNAAIGGPFELVSETGDTVTETQVLTQPSLIYFGYTYCPDVCPLDAARNAEAVDILAEEGHRVQPVFISIDPERDTPDVLAEFTDYLHPDMLGLTGTKEQVKAASQAYKTYYARRDGDDPDYYLMDHSVFTYLVLPDHGFVEFFQGAISGVEPEDMADRVGCFLDAAASV